ncbi:hypothetical protein CHS0354_009851, partial [Potamilus streckersoni]
MSNGYPKTTKMTNLDQYVSRLSLDNNWRKADLTFHFEKFRYFALYDPTVSVGGSDEGYNVSNVENGSNVSGN